jgi:hypothetical protein
MDLLDFTRQLKMGVESAELTIIMQQLVPDWYACTATLHRQQLSGQTVNEDVLRITLLHKTFNGITNAPS